MHTYRLFIAYIHVMFTKIVHKTLLIIIHTFDFIELELSGENQVGLTDVNIVKISLEYLSSCMSSVKTVISK